MHNKFLIIYIYIYIYIYIERERERERERAGGGHSLKKPNCKDHANLEKRSI